MPTKGLLQRDMVASDYIPRSVALDIDGAMRGEGQGGNRITSNVVNTYSAQSPLLSRVC
jgi:hypothetical protein